MYKHMYEERDHTVLYAKYRPTYSEYIYKTVLEFYENGKERETCKYDLAVDVGCGNAQNSRPFCRWFRHVIGCDVSEQQINSTNRDLHNLTFKVCPGEKMDFLENDSVDLITTAASLHWLDVDAFYKQVKRVLRPGGVFAAYSYTGCNGFDEKEANDVMWQFFDGLLGPYWDERYSHIRARYRTIDIPFEDHKRIELADVCVDDEMSVDAYIGYLSTLSAWRTYSKQHPSSQELEHVRDRLKKCYGDRNMKITWPGCLLLGRKPT